MIGYVTVGTNDLPRATAFFDKLFATIGAGRFLESDKFIAWATSPEAAGVCVTTPFDEGEATVGNGVMVALVVDSTEKVDEVYNKAIELGASDEGKPGPRGELSGFYAGYFRDLDGNKFNVFHMDMPEG
ncbi:VOC family protein [Thalassotalea sp. M1531]|uniref:VOC family protein n=1 Tax=Thalassotalea algicola TaxID=2716224 RepID=A0A7Y0LBV6_9GAMM|nr:VOC family protein [Thalassotalea algicola]NMP31571.1 VOC family protein [Thalassotalea algicola]